MNINGIEVNGQTKVATWYATAYPTDEWANEIMNRVLNFQQVYECLEIGCNIYAILGVEDSLVRERVLDVLATLMGCSYDHVYNQWLRNGRKGPYNGLQLYDMKGLRFTENI